MIHRWNISDIWSYAAWSNGTTQRWENWENAFNGFKLTKSPLKMEIFSQECQRFIYVTDDQTWAVTSSQLCSSEFILEWNRPDGQPHLRDIIAKKSIKRLLFINFQLNHQFVSASSYLAKNANRFRTLRSESRGPFSKNANGRNCSRRVCSIKKRINEPILAYCDIFNQKIDRFLTSPLGVSYYIILLYEDENCIVHNRSWFD